MSKQTICAYSNNILNLYVCLRKPFLEKLFRGSEEPLISVIRTNYRNEPKSCARQLVPSLEYTYTYHVTFMKTDKINIATYMPVW